MGWDCANWKDLDAVVAELTAGASCRDSYLHELHNKKQDAILWTIEDYPPGHLFIGCTLINGKPGYYCVKRMAEVEGPYYYSCPLSYLERVPDANADWRRQVYDYHNADPRQQALFGGGS